jgi:hypothetical protein
MSPEVAIAGYVAVLAAALRGHDRRTTRLDDRVLRKGFQASRSTRCCATPWRA